MAATDATAELSSDQADATLSSRPFIVLLVLVAIVGVIVSLAAWCFLEGNYQIQQELYTHLPHALGYQNGPPKWWPFPILAIGALLCALAITRLPGNGGHIPANGLAAGDPTRPAILPGVLAAGIATIGSGLILGPEAPLIAVGSGVALLLIGLARRETPPQALMVIAAAGSFAAVSFIFESPVIAAVLLIEAAAIGGPRLRIVLVPGLLSAGIGSLVSLGSAAGRTMSPVSAVVLMCGTLTGTNPFTLAKRVAVPLLVGVSVVVVLRLCGVL